MIDLLRVINKLGALPPLVSDVVIKLAETTQEKDWFKDSIIQSLGSRLVSSVEEAGFEDIDDLIERSVMDDLLYSWTS